MNRQTPKSTGLRVPVGQVTALLGHEASRSQVLHRLDVTQNAGETRPYILRLTAAATCSADERLAALDTAAKAQPVLLLVDRVTTGLDARERGALLSAVRAVAEHGIAVLVDDIDPIAALSVAGTALRVDEDGTVTAEELLLPAA